MLSPKQAAQQACVSTNLIYAWCAAGLLPHQRFGLLPCLRLGRRLLFNPTAVRAAIAELAAKPRLRKEDAPCRC